MIVKVALTLEPGGTELNDDAPRTTEVPRAGAAMLSSTPVTAPLVVFVNVTTVSCDDPGENVCKPGPAFAEASAGKGAAAADAGATLTRATSYLAATTLA